MDEPPPLRCPACQHEIAYDDAIRTVAGRRFHAACVDAHRTDGRSRSGSVAVIAEYIERVSRLLRR